MGADLWTRAADRLEKLDQAASESPWRRYGMTGVTSPDGDVIGEWRSRCDGCGEESTVIAAHTDDADLIVALRSLAPEVVSLLRAKARAAEVRQRTVPGFAFRDHAMDRIARIVLGETEAPTQEGNHHTMTAIGPRTPSGKRLTGDARTTFVAEITRRYLAGASIRDIATDTGCAYGSIHRMLTENDVTLRSRGGANRKTAAKS